MNEEKILNTIVKPKKRLYYLDFLRIMAAFAVVTVHCNVGRTHIISSLYSNTFEYCIYMFYNCFSRFTVSTFVMISGVLFLDNSKPLPIKKLYSKTIFKILISYAFGVLLTYATYIFLYKSFNFKDCFISTSYPLWFLPMIMSLYILTPIFRKITEDEKLNKYFLVVSITITVIIPTLFFFPYFEILEYIYNYFTRGINLGYVSCFLLGYYLSKKSFSKKTRIIIYVVGIMSSVVSTALTIMDVHNTKAISERFVENLSILMVAESVALFVFSKQIFSKKNLNQNFCKILSFISKYTFGIYLVHVPVILIFKQCFNIEKYLNVYFIINPFISALFFFVVSFIISFILKQIPLIKKYIG